MMFSFSLSWSAVVALLVLLVLLEPFVLLVLLVVLEPIRLLVLLVALRALGDPS